jgi:SAM-dependent methyltransferase
MDVREGPNVDRVIDPRRKNWSCYGTFDLVITGNTMEHVPSPFAFGRQLRTLMKPKARLVVLAPWRWPIHYHPIDAWRILPDGMRAIFGVAGVHVVRMGTTDYENGNGDTWAIGSLQRSDEPNEVVKFWHEAQSDVKFVIRMDDRRKEAHERGNC